MQKSFDTSVSLPTPINLESRVAYKSTKERIYHAILNKHSYITRITSKALKEYQVGS